ncbi:hypothetical protein F4859DRAFT_497877 [Xylaria cf. heliscus]|nr:hypothetical protein F4859DRAFT_497877 [Xylaria cf. heliscus]
MTAHYLTFNLALHSTFAVLQPNLELMFLSCIPFIIPGKSERLSLQRSSYLQRSGDSFILAEVVALVSWFGAHRSYMSSWVCVLLHEGARQCGATNRWSRSRSPM